MREKMKKPIFYDTETTGVNASNDRIIEIAAYDPVEDRTFSSFVNPGMPIPEESSRITGITDSMVEDAKSFAQIGKEFFDFCGNDIVLVAHNGDSFDRHFLKNESERHEIDFPDFKHFDTLKWSRRYRTDLPRHSLQYLREVFQIAENNAHRALDDVMVLYRVYKYLVGDLSIKEAMDLLYNREETVRQMPFGKHRGELLEKVPKNYLKWLAQSGALDKPGNEDLKSSLKKLQLI